MFLLPMSRHQVQRTTKDTYKTRSKTKVSFSKTVIIVSFSASGFLEQHTSRAMYDIVAENIWYICLSVRAMVDLSYERFIAVPYNLNYQSTFKNRWL